MRSEVKGGEVDGVSSAEGASLVPCGGGTAGEVCLFLQSNFIAALGGTLYWLYRVHY